ncbi:hypothetical protein AN189_02890 [Loktanella sp. 3ANDIMAR09]|uniref:hypothetical protein n=1 Tax=Loktanella sp. 3ANDIMAR09 TaxID=1225657 RepID=UPI00070809C6|nr:hypothetical protein [Loktanella sp. 3ANDIMAR09]KQI69387.1 hypothetical protein AN189_02890 [Loktanella sp. 3ANDIMAR09]
MEKSYPVLSRLRRSGVVYAPGTDRDTVELAEREADRLAALGVVGPATEPDDATTPEDHALSLADRLAALKADGHDVGALNMADLHKLLGKGHEGAKRADVDAALKDLAQARQTPVS